MDVRSVLNSMNIKQIKQLVKMHNLHYFVKVNQSKDALINQLESMYSVSDQGDKKYLILKNSKEIPIEFSLSTPKEKKVKVAKEPKAPKEPKVRKMTVSKKKTEVAKKEEEQPKVSQEVIRQPEVLPSEKIKTPITLNDILEEPTKKIIKKITVPKKQKAVVEDTRTEEEKSLTPKEYEAWQQIKDIKEQPYILRNKIERLREKINADELQDVPPDDRKKGKYNLPSIYLETFPEMYYQDESFSKSPLKNEYKIFADLIKKNQNMTFINDKVKKMWEQKNNKRFI